MTKLRAWLERVACVLFGFDPDDPREQLLPEASANHVRNVNPPPQVTETEAMPDGDDIMSGRCREGRWRVDGTCDFCGGHRPSKALVLMARGALVTPTDKNYKCYVSGLPNGGKVYFNHFGEAQAVELVRRIECKQLNLAQPGYFYSGLPFAPYKNAIQKLLRDLKEQLPLP